jgi:hypothetical protein
MRGRAATVSVDYGPEEAAMRACCGAGERRALALGNRGPVRFGRDGKVHRDILDAYWLHGFYVFEGVFGPEELAELEADLHDILDRLPTGPGSPVDHKGRPALAADLEGNTLFWSRPLADPLGGTDLANGRHPVKMFEPVPAADAPEEVVYLILGAVQFSDAALRAYGHPHLLAVAAAVNGDDFATLQRGHLHQGAGPRRVGALAPGRHDALGQSRLGRGHARLQLHGAAVRLHGRQRRLGGARIAQARQGRHPGDGRGGRHGAAAGCGAHRVRTG